MTLGPLPAAIVRRLELAGYKRLATPFAVASVRFDFTSALRGQGGRSSDLVLVVDTSTGEFGDQSGERTSQRIEALGRALDMTGSHLVVTVILAGAPLPPADVEAISRTCRVLRTDEIEVSSSGVLTDSVAEDLEDCLRVLLPLNLDEGSEETADPIRELEERLPADIDQTISQPLIAASTGGATRVSRELAKLLSDALQPGLPA